MKYTLLLAMMVGGSLNSMQKLRDDLVRIKEKRWAIADVYSWSGDTQYMTAENRSKLCKMLDALAAEVEAQKSVLTQYIKLQKMYRAEARTIKKLRARIQ